MQRIAELTVTVDLVPIFQGLKLPASDILWALATSMQDKQANEVAEVILSAARKVQSLESGPTSIGIPPNNPTNPKQEKEFFSR